MHARQPVPSGSPSPGDAPPRPPDRPSSEAHRGDRLHPRRTEAIYWHLITLRDAYRELIAEATEGASDVTVVDYGCGAMPYRPLFTQAGCRYLGADLIGNTEADLTFDAAGRLDLADAGCDLVLSSQVLEHVPDPAAYLAEARRVLRPGGRLLLSTHGVWPYHPDPTDFWRWTSEGLKTTVARAGYAIERFRGLMGPEATALQLWSDDRLRRLHPWLYPTFNWVMQGRIERADRRCPPERRDRDAAVYVLMARKA